jgi:hypothetical protein
VSQSPKIPTPLIELVPITIFSIVFVDSVAPSSVPQAKRKHFLERRMILLQSLSYDSLTDSSYISWRLARSHTFKAWSHGIGVFKETLQFSSSTPSTSSPTISYVLTNNNQHFHLSLFYSYTLFRPLYVHTKTIPGCETDPLRICLNETTKQSQTLHSWH